MKPLSVRVAERVAAKKGAPAPEKNRAAFIIHRTEIQSAIDKGWPILQVWQTLREEESISYGYHAFRRHVHQLCTKPAE